MTQQPSPEDMKQAPPQVPIDPNKLFLPGAILVAGLMISGTILYTNTTATIGDVAAQKNTPDTSKKISVANLKKWAKEIKVNTKAFDECLDTGKYKDEIKKDIADAQLVGVTGTPSFFINGRSVVGAQPFASFKAIIDEELNNVATKDTRAEVSVDDDAVLGNPDAPVTIIEFSDYECPFCKRFFDSALSDIKREYIDTGKAKLVYRDYPLSFHPGAEPAALAANCAGEQGKYWEMHDKIFSSQ